MTHGKFVVIEICHCISVHPFDCLYVGMSVCPSVCLKISNFVTKVDKGPMDTFLVYC